MNSNISDIAMEPIKLRSLPPENHRSPPPASSASPSLRLPRQGSIGGGSPTTEVYFRDSPVSVPFRWESRPGTPKAHFGDRRPLPPLTPPPSYISSPARIHRAKAAEIHSGGGVLHGVLPRLNLIKKSHHNRRSSPSLSSSSSSSSSSARSSPCTPDSYGAPARRKLLSQHFNEVEDDGEDEVSNVGSLCFGTKRSCSASFIKLLLRQHA